MPGKPLLIGLLLTAALITWLVVSWRPTPAVPTGFSPTSLPDGTMAPADSAAEQPVIPGRDENGAIHDALRHPETVELSEGVYALFGENLTREQPFVVTYYAFDDSYRAAILQEPLAASRQALARALQDRLGASEAELCALDVRVGVPVAVNPALADRALGLPFCPGAVRLE